MVVVCAESCRCCLSLSRSAPAADAQSEWLLWILEELDDDTSTMVTEAQNNRGSLMRGRPNRIQ